MPASRASVPARGSAIANLSSIDDLKKRGAGRPAPSDVVRLYHQAFAEFDTESLWRRRPSAQPTITQALVLADNLRRNGSMRSRPLATAIEADCRAAV